jgi:hypothetical protein
MPNGYGWLDLLRSRRNAEAGDGLACSASVVRIYSLATVDAHAMPMWHHKSVIALFQIVLRLLIDLIALSALGFRQRRATAAEILVLRRQIALYKERGIKPRQIDPVTRISLALLSRFFQTVKFLAIVDVDQLGYARWRPLDIEMPLLGPLILRQASHR